MTLTHEHPSLTTSPRARCSCWRRVTVDKCKCSARVYVTCAVVQCHVLNLICLLQRASLPYLPLLLATHITRRVRFASHTAQTPEMVTASVVEVIGQVQPDLSVQEMTLTNFAENFGNTNALVVVSHCVMVLTLTLCMLHICM